MNYHILDTETASLTGGVCEFAYLEVNDKLEILSEFSTLVNPERPIEEGAFAVHGISDEAVAGKPKMSEIAAHFSEPLNLIGHNCSFDERMIKEHIKVGAKLCTLAEARLHIKGTTNHKLETLQKELGLPVQTSHSALGDVHTARDLLLYIINLTKTDFPTLWQRAQQPKMLHKMPFGKHKGKPFTLIPRKDIDWLLTLNDLDKDLRYTLQIHRGIL